MARKEKQNKKAAQPQDKDKTQAQAAETPDVAKAAGKASTRPDPEVDAIRERLLRLQADFENFRKRTLREKNELYRQANEDLMLELLPVLDHLDLALAAAREHGADEAFVEGFRLVSEQMLAALQKFGLNPIDAGHDVFDPNRHEAISHLASDEIPENHVMTQVRRGYALGDRLLRPAQVVVSSGPGPGDTGERPADDREPETSGEA